jgi:hypothetical protein
VPGTGLRGHLCCEIREIGRCFSGTTGCHPTVPSSPYEYDTGGVTRRQGGHLPVCAAFHVGRLPPKRSDMGAAGEAFGQAGPGQVRGNEEEGGREARGGAIGLGCLITQLPAHHV